MNNKSTTLEFALELDKTDPLAKFRDMFHIPQHDSLDSIYLCGNSLGLQPKSVEKLLQEELKSWRENGVEGHFKSTHWVSYHEKIGKMMAKLVGAQSEEVVIMNTLTVNLHLLMVSFYRPTKDRYKIIIESNAFPSDQYAVKSQIRFHGYDPKDALIELKANPETGTIDNDTIKQAIQNAGSSLALVMLGGVNYYTGQVFDMQQITEWGHSQGALVGFDLAHAVGNIELELHDWNVDFAVWCTYKYLNSGPGAIAGAFVHDLHKQANLPRFEGWWGVKKMKRFLMTPDFEPIGGAESWQLSNPPIFSMTPMKASLSIFLEAGMQQLCNKSQKLTNYLEYLIKSIDNDNYWITPDASIRGCQISLHVKSDGKAVYSKLSERGVICDWREPDVIRIAPVPLYNSFHDIYRFYEILKSL